MSLRDRLAKAAVPSTVPAAAPLVSPEPVACDGQARDQAAPGPSCQPGAPAISKEVETVTKTDKKAKKQVEEAEKLAKIPASRVPRSVEPLSDSAETMQLRTPEAVDMARLQVHREAMDAFEALKTRLEYLNPIDQRELKRLLTIELGEDGDDFDHDFDLKEEINAQLRMLRTMRSRAERENISTRELKETLTASSSLITMLIKEQEKVVNIDRLRTVERAVVEAIKEQSHEVQEAFLSFLEGKLDGYAR